VEAWASSVWLYYIILFLFLLWRSSLCGFLENSWESVSRFSSIMGADWSVTLVQCTCRFRSCFPELHGYEVWKLSMVMISISVPMYVGMVL